MFGLTEEHMEQHNFLNYCCSCLLNIISYIDENKSVREDLHFENESLKTEFQNKCSTLTETEKIKWLVDNGCKKNIYDFYYKHLFFSLIVDFSNYYNASVEMAYKGNIYVAWSLLRKPLQETLAYIEWLYVEKYELIELMLMNAKPQKYELMNPTNKSKIKNNIYKIQSEEERQIIDICKFRYNRKDTFSINGILQATNHLITDRSALKTSPGGLNFVCPNEETINRNIGFYYTAIPYVMQYAMKIIFEMFFEIAEFDDYSRKINLLNLKLKEFEAMKMEFKKAKEILRLNNTEIRCPHCNVSFSTDEKWIDFTNNRFKCNKCFQEIHTFGLIFDYILNKTEENKNE